MMKNFLLIVVVIMLGRPVFSQDCSILGEPIQLTKISKTQGGFSGQLNGSLFGGSVSTIGDLDNDGVSDLAVGVYVDGDGGASKGSVRVLFMNKDGSVKSDQRISDTAGNFTGIFYGADNFGSSVCGLGDIDGDNIEDIVVGAINYKDTGAIWILLLNMDGTVKDYQLISSHEGGITSEIDGLSSFGSSITVVGDLNSNGSKDLAVGAYTDDYYGSRKGAIFILFMDSGMVDSVQKITEGVAGFNETLDSLGGFGYSLCSLGDLNGNGVNDIVVGAPAQNDGGINKGAIFVLFMDSSGTVDSSQGISATKGNLGYNLSINSEFGRAIECLGDIDGDNVVDIVVSAPRSSASGGTERGGFYILTLNPNGTVKSSLYISDTTSLLADSLQNGDLFGASIVVLGDLDHDGHLNIAVGALGDDDGGLNNGAVYMLDLCVIKDTTSCIAGRPQFFQKISQTAGEFQGELNASRFGHGIENIGDLDNDGIVDLAVGCRRDADGGANHGAVWILFMNSDGTIKSQTKISDTTGNFTGEFSGADQFGNCIAGVGDINKDGVEDIAVAAYRYDGSRGAVWLLFLDAIGSVKDYKLFASETGGMDSLNAGAYFGWSIDTLGDLNGDGMTELVVGSPRDNLGNGRIQVLFLDSTFTIDSIQTIEEGMGNFFGDLEDYDFFGDGMRCIGDLNRDGINDLVVSALLDDDGGTSRGALWVLFMDAIGKVKSHTKISHISGGLNIPLGNHFRLGTDIDLLGDIDNDSIPDIVVGAYGGSIDSIANRGSVMILALDTNGTTKWQYLISDTTDFLRGILDDQDDFGVGLSSLGDLNKDGTIEIAVGTDRDDDGGADNGAVYIISICSQRPIDECSLALAGQAQTDSNADSLLTYGKVYLFSLSDSATVLDSAYIAYGNYAFTKLCPGNYILKAVALGIDEHKYCHTYNYSELDFTKVLPINLSEDAYDKDILLKDNPCIIELSGRVIRLKALTSKRGMFTYMNLPTAH